MRHPAGLAAGQHPRRAPDASQQPAGRHSQGHPAHCLLQGSLHERTGQDGKRYAIRFELRLPQGWTGRLLHPLNNGTGGQVIPAWGALGVMAGPGQDALSRGFAVLSSDDGHDADDPAQLPAGLLRGTAFGLDAQARHRGKLLLCHGNSDPAFSINTTLAWGARLQHTLGAAAAGQVARVFQVPGMGHCHGGPATDQFDALGALLAWVENGRAPDRIETHVNPTNRELPAGSAYRRSQPLCAWPQVAR